jgi:hypothetical protein
VRTVEPREAALARSEAGPMTRPARELAYRSARRAKAKASGVDRMLRRGSDPARDPTPGPRGARRRQEDRRESTGPRSLLVGSAVLSRRGSHPYRPRKPYPEPKLVPVVHSASSRARGTTGTECSPRTLPATRPASQPCLASGSSVHVAPERACRPVARTRCVRSGEPPAPPNRAHRGRNRGVIATPSCLRDRALPAPRRGRPELTRDAPSGIGQAPLGLEAIAALQPTGPACGAGHRNLPCDVQTTEASRLPMDSGCVDDRLAKSYSRLVRTVTAAWSGCRFVNGRRCTTCRRCEPPRKRQLLPFLARSENQ